MCSLASLRSCAHVFICSYVHVCSCARVSLVECAHMAIAFDSCSHGRRQHSQRALAQRISVIRLRSVTRSFGRSFGHLGSATRSELTFLRTQTHNTFGVDGTQFTMATIVNCRQSPVNRVPSQLASQRSMLDTGRLLRRLSTPRSAG